VARAEVVAALEAGWSWAIAEERPKSARIAASKRIFKVGRSFIVVFSSNGIAAKSEISFRCTDTVL